MYLWHRDMTLVDNHEEVFRKEVEQTIRTRTWSTTVKVAAVVLDTRTMSELANHLDVISYALIKTFCFKLFPLIFKESNLLAKVGGPWQIADADPRAVGALTRGARRGAIDALVASVATLPDRTRSRLHRATEIVASLV